MKFLTKIALFTALLTGTASVSAALDTNGADYKATSSESYINSGPASDSLSMVDFLLCVMVNSNASAHPNETYSSMIDENVCNGVVSSSPAFAVQTMVTSRAAQADDYIVKSWFVTAEGGTIVAEISITSAPTEALPRGVFTMVWNMVSESNVANGQGGILSAKDDNTISYIEKMGNHLGGIDNSYIHGTIDGSNGNLRVKSQDWSTGSAVDKIYKYVFNANTVHYNEDPSATAVCLDRTVANMVKRNRAYKLFTEAGAEVKLAGPFDFSYVDPQDNSDQRGWADQWGAWLQGGEDDTSGKARPTTITRNSNDKIYTVCWDDDDTSNVCGAADDDIRYQLTHAVDGIYSFDDPIEFDARTVLDPSDGSDVAGSDAWAGRSPANGTYRGAGSNLDLPWQCQIAVENVLTYVDQSGNNCDNSSQWRPKYSVADGTEFIRKGTTDKYYVKAIDAEINLAPHADASASCALVPALALSTAPDALTNYVIPDISATTLWTDKPTVANGKLLEANVMKVIHGVEQ